MKLIRRWIYVQNMIHLNMFETLEITFLQKIRRREGEPYKVRKILTASISTYMDKHSLATKKVLEQQAVGSGLAP